jgi:hypothetical protein
MMAHILTFLILDVYLIVNIALSIALSTYNFFIKADCC